MADVTLSYKGSDILELSDSGSATLKTGGKYCEDDIAVEYVKPSGGGGVLDGINNITFGAQAFNISTADIIDNRLVVDLSGKNVTFLSQVFTINTVSNLDIEIICNRISLITTPFSFPQGSYGNASVTITADQEYIDFTGQHFTGGTGSTVSIPYFYTPPIRIASALSNNYGAFSRAQNLVHISLWENYAKGVMYFGGCSGLDNFTIISIANALMAENPNTVTYHATPKAKLSTIMGTIESVTRDEETYDRFVADENGTVTLLDFITNTKGWTVA